MIVTIENWSTREKTKIDCISFDGNSKMYVWEFYVFDETKGKVLTACYPTKFYNIINIWRK